MCFPSMFIQTIVDVYRSKSKGQKLFFPLFIFRILRYLEMFEFPSLELVHIMAPIGTTYTRQRQAQMKSDEPSTGCLRDQEEMLPQPLVPCLLLRRLMWILLLLWICWTYSGCWSSFVTLSHDAVYHDDSGCSGTVA